MVFRYAVYAAPGFGQTDATGMLLRERAESWFGRSANGRPVHAGAPKGWARADIDRITVDATRYGFHATLKAPFCLAPGASAEQLNDAIDMFARSRQRIIIPALSVSRIDGFYALTPEWAQPELDTLAADIVTGLDRFRAPATAEEVARRKPEQLTPHQRELLHTFGYPFVLDQFRFHLTVTDRIDIDRHDAVEAALREWFDIALGRTLVLGAIALFVEPGPGEPFRLSSIHQLGSP